MSEESSFNDQIKSNYAFVAKSVFDLHCLIQAQSETLYAEKEMGFPVWASSTLLFLAGTKHASIMQISQALSLSHQLTSQRIKMLLKLELIEGVQDPSDKRRTMYHLSETGKQKAQILDLYCQDAAKAFMDLSNEVGVDIQATLNAAISALTKKSFGKRFPENPKSYAQRIAEKTK